MKTETMIYNGVRLPVVRRKILSRKVEHLNFSEIPFHELLKAEHTIEHTPEGPRLIVRGKPKKLREWLASQKNPNQVFFGEMCNPAFVFQLVVTFADFRFISAPWGSLENPPPEYFTGARIEKGSWLVLPDGVRVHGMTDADLPADERAANAAQLAGDALGAVREEMRRAHGQNAEMLGKVMAQGSDIVEEARRLKKGKREAEGKPFESAMKVTNLIGNRLKLESRNLLYAMQSAKGNQSLAANELKVKPCTVNKKLPALRQEILAAGFELPEYMITPKKRKRIPDGHGPVAFENEKVVKVDTRTPADEVMENEERELAEKYEGDSEPE